MRHSGSHGGNQTFDRHQKPVGGNTDNTNFRPIDGTGSNPDNPDFGAAGQTLLRLADANYEDGIGDMADNLPSAREISNALSEQDGDVLNELGASDLLWAWGQFIDHDIDLSESGSTEFVPIAVPGGDPDFDPDGSGNALIPFYRVDPVDGTGETTPRQYENQITSFLDASMVYGADAETAAALRGPGGTLLLDEDGFLVRTDDGGVLAGDIRAAENVGLTSLHTLFAREHNFWVARLARHNPDLSDDDLYNMARQRVEAEIQAVTFNEFLPVLVGDDTIPAYSGYDPTVNPGISVEFSTAVYRFGHSLLSSTIQRLDENGNEIAAGNLALSDAFFAPGEITDNGGIAPILRGLADSTAQEVDMMIVEDVRSFLFGAPGDGGLDLAALNIQRGRDLGVATYNDLREALGLARAETFFDITGDADVAAALEAVYGDVDLVEAWIGGLAEPAVNGGLLGELFSTVLVDQFLRLRDGDPYWSENSGLPQSQIDGLWDTKLADIIERNSDVGAIQDEIFFAYDRQAGGKGDDTLTGDADRDLLLGLGGDDSLAGADNHDQLEGGRGNDTLDGGAGDDVMTGGRGADLFIVTAAGTGADIITDFGRGDQVDISDFGLFETVDDLDLARSGNDALLTLDADHSVLFEDTGLNELRGDDFVLIA